jgi:cell wall-associated NlpC family hydrolase
MAAPDLLQIGTIWRLLTAVNGFSRPRGDGLATQAWAGRHFQVLEPPQPGADGRLRARLLEDGYPCWLEPGALLGQAVAVAAPHPALLSGAAIHGRLQAVLAFAEAAQQQTNTYLWGGSLGPDYDCSGLVQRAFASAGMPICRSGSASPWRCALGCCMRCCPGT